MNCRAAKKVLHLAPIEITCIKCETKFNFSAAAQKHFKEQGWVVPIRCFDCRKTNKMEYNEKMAREAAEKVAEVPAPVAVAPPLPPA